MGSLTGKNKRKPKGIKQSSVITYSPLNVGEWGNASGIRDPGYRKTGAELDPGKSDPGYKKTGVELDPGKSDPGYKKTGVELDPGRSDPGYKKTGAELDPGKSDPGYKKTGAELDPGKSDPGYKKTGAELDPGKSDPGYKKTGVELDPGKLDPGYKKTGVELDPGKLDPGYKKTGVDLDPGKSDPGYKKTGAELDPGKSDPGYKKTGVELDPGKSDPGYKKTGVEFDPEHKGEIVKSSDRNGEKEGDHEDIQSREMDRVSEVNSSNKSYNYNSGIMNTVIACLLKHDLTVKEALFLSEAMFDGVVNKYSISKKLGIKEREAYRLVDNLVKKRALVIDKKSQGTLVSKSFKKSWACYIRKLSSLKLNNCELKIISLYVGLQVVSSKTKFILTSKKIEEKTKIERSNQKRYLRSLQDKDLLTYKLDPRFKKNIHEPNFVKILN